MPKLKKTIDLTKYGLDIKKIEMQTLDGNDHIAAAMRVLPLDGKPMDPHLFRIMLQAQMIAGSITKVDGVDQPGSCQDSIKWSIRTREFVGIAFDYMNGISGDEREGFMAELAGGSAPPATTPATSKQS